MKQYLFFAIKRLIQLVAVIFVGCTAAFFISHALARSVRWSRSSAGWRGSPPIAPRPSSRCAQTLTELFGLNVPLHIQYLNFLKRLVVGDFGPSLIAFPRPAIELVMLALPWTVGLLTVSITITWVIGNIAGGLAGYFQNSRLSRPSASSPSAFSRSPTTSSPS